MKHTPMVDARVYSVADALTGFARRNVTREEAHKILLAYREACAVAGWRCQPRVYYRDGSDVTHEVCP